MKKLKNIKETLYILDDGTELNKNELFDNFELGYSTTLFKAQGQQYKSFYFQI
jgi:hypothetical protein